MFFNRTTVASYIYATFYFSFFLSFSKRTVRITCFIHVFL